MAKVMVSFPDDLLVALDAEVGRRGTTRSALLQEAARREVGLMSEAKRAEIIAKLDEFGRAWSGPVDAAALIREDRDHGH